MAMSQKQLNAYLDRPASHREVLNAIEQLLAMHEERYHQSGVRRLYNRLLHNARRMRLSIREARRA